jgi:hypothetical protein
LDLGPCRQPVGAQPTRGEDKLLTSYELLEGLPEWLRHINHGDLATPPLFMVFDLLQLGETTEKWRYSTLN